MVVTALLLLSGCAVGPNYRPPEVSVPAAFTGAAAATPSTNATLPLAEWWQIFEDPQLNRLLQQAAVANLDLRLAAARVREVRAESGVVRSRLLPQVNASGSYDRSRLSENSLNGQAIQAAGQDLSADTYTGGFSLNWELDIFGGRRRALEASLAELSAAEETQHGVRVAILAEVGLQYLELRGRQKQLAVAADNLRSQEETLELIRDRRKAGLSSDLEVNQAAAQVATTRSLIPPLEQRRQQALHRLGILLGQAPTALESELAAVQPLPSAVPRIPLGLPSDLLRRRPDIRRAEREVAATTARIGVATADLFPKFYLTGAAGLQSLDAGDFFTQGSRFWSLGPSLNWPVFTAGRIRQQIEVQNARQEQSLVRYEQTVLTSLEEVENALVAYGQEQLRLEALAEAERSTARTVELAQQRYRGGLVDFLNVLESQRSLFSVQEQRIASERQQGQNLILLYRALGGGWEAPTTPTAVAATP